jgi:hypothetical protein
MGIAGRGFAVLRCQSDVTVHRCLAEEFSLEQFSNPFAGPQILEGLVRGVFCVAIFPEGSVPAWLFLVGV